MRALITLENLQHFKQLFQDDISHLINDAVNNAVTGGSINLVTVQSIYPVGSIYISKLN